MRWKEKLLKPFDLYAVSEARPYLMGIATLWITFYHCKYLDLFRSDFLARTRLLGLITRIEAIGNCGVDLFFFLSGLGLYFSYTRLRESDPRPVRSFYLRRYRRVVPTILIVTILTFGMAEKTDLANWAGGVFLYGFFVPGLTRGNFWFLSAILVLYLVFPLIHRGLRGGRGTAGALGMALGFLAAGLALRFLAEEYFFTHIALMLCRMPVFVLGAWMGRLCMEHRKVPAFVPLLAVPLSVLLLVLIADIPLDMDLRFYEYAALIPCIALAHACVFSLFRKRGFVSKAVTVVGGYSMEIYLIFETVYNRGDGLIFSPEGTGLVYALTAFTATLVLAVLLKFTVGQLLRAYDALGGKPADREEAAK